MYPKIIDIIFGRRTIIMVFVVGVASFEYMEDGELQSRSLKIRQDISTRRRGWFERGSVAYVDIPTDLLYTTGCIRYECGDDIYVT